MFVLVVSDSVFKCERLGVRGALHDRHLVILMTKPPD